MAIVLGIGLAMYILLCLPLFIIARKLGVSKPILAFVPIAQNWTLNSAAGLSFVWFLLSFTPLFLYHIMRISERLGKNKFVGLLLVIFLNFLGFLILAIIGKPERAVSSAGSKAIPDLGGEPDLDLPDMDDMGFDMEDDSFASDSGFGSEEGIGEHSDDFGTAGEEPGGDDFDMDLEPGEDDFDTADEEHKADGFDLGENAGGGDDDGFGFDFDDKS